MSSNGGAGCSSAAACSLSAASGAACGLVSPPQADAATRRKAVPATRTSRTFMFTPVLVLCAEFFDVGSHDLWARSHFGGGVRRRYGQFLPPWAFRREMGGLPNLVVTQSTGRI